jgi:hypothetical protein
VVWLVLRYAGVSYRHQQGFASAFRNFEGFNVWGVHPIVRGIQKSESPGCCVPEFDPALENISFVGTVVCEQRRTPSKVGLHPIVKHTLIA